MQRITLEKNQVWLYLGAILIGIAVGQLWDAQRSVFEQLLWPVLAALLYVTFLQVPLLHLKEALKDYRFTAAVLLGNFVLLPLGCWGLIQLLPPDPALRLGVLLVLLVPCTDWFITFTQLGRGHTAAAVAVTPLNLLLQLLLLPLYLWLILGTQGLQSLPLDSVLPAFLVVALPFMLALVTERSFDKSTFWPVWREKLAWWPVPLLMIVVFLIAAAQADMMVEASDLLPIVVPVFVAFLIMAGLLAKVLARFFLLPTAQGRTLAFSLGTRNSFVVLPFAIALPPGWETVVIVIVLQSLVELAGMMVYLWWVPNQLFKEGK